MTDKTNITIALAGQPNVGKSTVFNLLTGLNQHVGNWPGKTVEQKTGIFQYNGNQYNIVDLPGTYSLTANSAEEVIARDFIIQKKPQLVVAVVNAAALKRNLYLVSELLSLNVPVILALNMIDVAKEEGQKIIPDMLEKNMGIKVVPMIAAKNIGVTELGREIDRLARGKNDYKPYLPEMNSELLATVKDMEQIIDQYVPRHQPKDWTAMKLLEEDQIVTGSMQKKMNSNTWEKVTGLLSKNRDIMQSLADDRYRWVDTVSKKAIISSKSSGLSRSARWDRYAAHPVWGFFIMLLLVAVGLLLAKLTGLKFTWIAMDHLLPLIKESAAGMLTGTPAWFSHLITDGIVSGLGVLTIFTVFLTIFFALLGALEDVGYLARVGYLMHRFMRRIGLHGKSFLPLGIGFACNVPGVIGARVGETERARLMTILLTPFVPCIAQTGVTVFLSTIFYGAWAPVVVILLIMMNMGVLAFTGILLNKSLPGQERLGLIMELPLYHWPNPRTIGTYVWHQMKHFMERAGTLIFSVTVLIWALGYFPDGKMETSFLASIGHFLMPLGDLMGLSWEMLVSLFASFVAKETAIASMGVLFGGENLVTALQNSVTPAAGLGFLVTHMLFIPCVATLAVIVGEAKSWKWASAILGYLFVVAFGMGIMVYQIANLIM